MPLKPKMTKSQATARDFAAGQARREKFLELLYTGKYTKMKEIWPLVPITEKTYYVWRQNYKDFAAQVDAYVRPGQVVKANTKWDQGFALFRKEFFGFDSPWFHLKIIHALESGEPGSVTLITIPPEHGKTTLLEDYINYKLALDPTFRVVVASEKQAHARKIIKRVKHRMEPEGSARSYVHRFGPFKAPPKHPTSRSQPWAADFFDVFKKGAFDDRDYSVVGLGMGSAVAGTRTDLLIPDDPQSLKSLDQTDALFETFRQDWLSRPGSKGRTVVIMTRVGEGDFAEKLMDSEILSHHIVIPAWSEEHGWLWPERYSEAEYAIMRRNVGEDAWERNYMQVARPAHTVVFTKPTIEMGRDGLRTTLHVANRLNGQGILVGLDPGFNVTGLTAASDGPKFEILASRKRVNLSGTEAIIGELEDLIHTVHLPEHPVTDVVIESMAFQQGLITDDRIIALQRIYGFRIHPHQTGNNKSDPDMGVPQMVHSLLREEITWPWADDHSRSELGALEADMYRWRPGKRGRGTKIEQDCLMSTWFIWLLWRTRHRQNRALNSEQFRSRPAPALMIGGRV